MDEDKLRAAREWSDRHATKDIVRYDYAAYVEYETWAGRDPITEDEYLDAYTAAWVTGDECYRNRRHGKPSGALRYWFVDVVRSDERVQVYEERY